MQTDVPDSSCIFPTTGLEEWVISTRSSGFFQWRVFGNQDQGIRYAHYPGMSLLFGPLNSLSFYWYFQFQFSIKRYILVFLFSHWQATPFSSNEKPASHYLQCIYSSIEYTESNFRIVKPTLLLIVTVLIIVEYLFLNTNLFLNTVKCTNLHGII